MNFTLDKAFHKQLKKSPVRIRKSVKQRLLLFFKNHNSPQLNNHTLQREWQGHRSINITADWRAIYIERKIKGETIAYFVTLGTHKELYR